MTIPEKFSADRLATTNAVTTLELIILQIPYIVDVDLCQGRILLPARIAGVMCPYSCFGTQRGYVEQQNGSRDCPRNTRVRAGFFIRLSIGRVPRNGTKIIRWLLTVRDAALIAADSVID